MSYCPDDFECPDWDRVSRVHDWKNYINDDLRKAWSSFSIEQRRIIANNADEIASRENWD